MRLLLILVTAAAAAPRATLAQAAPLRIAGTWQAQTPDGPREVVIRADSSASYGEETVRWRIRADSIYLAFGDEWVGYVLKLKGNQLVVSGGDLEEPMSLKRVGPPNERPDSIPVPPAPRMARPKSATPG